MDFASTDALSVIEKTLLKDEGKRERGESESPTQKGLTNTSL